MPLPERILRPNCWKTLGLLLICLLFTLTGVWMALDGKAEGWLGAGLFGLGCLFFLVVLLPNSTYLQLDAEKFEIRTLFRTNAIPWSDVDHFEAGFIGLNRMVVFNYAPHSQRSRLGRKVATALALWEGALPDTYGLTPDALADLMNEYKLASVVDLLD